LSSDAFSAFGKIDKDIHNQEVAEATLQLESHIKEIAKNLQSMEPSTFIRFLHSEGQILFSSRFFLFSLFFQIKQKEEEKSDTSNTLTQELI
jgi:hypothetical protein